MLTKKKYGTKDLEKDFGPVTFAKLLSSFRLSAGLTQEELGKKIGGMPRAMVCDFEKGRRIPSPEKAYEIARKLKQIESYWVQIAIQDYLDQHEIDYQVKLA